MAKPKLALIPSGYSDGKVYSVLPSNGDGDFTFSRGSNATRVNKDGLIETVDEDLPRLDYSDSSCPSLLLEPTSTNLIQYSEDFSNSYWIKSSGLTVADGFLAPDGTLNAYSFSSVTDGRSIYNFGEWTTTEKTFSIFAKKGSTDSFEIRNPSANSSSVFDLTNGIISSSTTDMDAIIEEYNNGWYRCSATHTATSSQTLAFYSTYGGTDSIYIWGAQLEVGSYPTSYIPTNGTAATRLADECNGAGTSDTFNDSEGVLMAEISALSNDGTNRRISISNGSSSDRVLLGYTSSSNQLIVLVSSNSVSGVASLVNIDNSLQFNKIALKYKLNDFALWINGIKVLTDNSLNAPIGLSTLRFEDGNGSNDFYGNTKQVQYYNTALTGSELEELTSWESFIQMANGQNYTIK